MTANVRMNTTTATAGASSLWGAVTRAVSGGGLFMTEFTANAGPGGVAFAPKIPGQIVPVEVRAGTGYMVHKHGFLCATQGVLPQHRLSAITGRGRVRRRRLHPAAPDRQLSGLGRPGRRNRQQRSGTG